MTTKKAEDSDVYDMLIAELDVCLNDVRPSVSGCVGKIRELSFLNKGLIKQIADMVVSKAKENPKLSVVYAEICSQVIHLAYRGVVPFDCPFRDALKSSLEEVAKTVGNSGSPRMADHSGVHKLILHIYNHQRANMYKNRLFPLTVVQSCMMGLVRSRMEKMPTSETGPAESSGATPVSQDGETSRQSQISSSMGRGQKSKSDAILEEPLCEEDVDGGKDLYQLRKELKLVRAELRANRVEFEAEIARLTAELKSKDEEKRQTTHDE